ncbi:pyridoxal phosphate-dependent transferase [Neohortaea acidophila]|uniref:Pyridoxal phosphate-dependent transferase n=1 Tax=Neohortaea acidophila TaxID=245834 RepID=A0A6A6PFX5_9PEZI|nr:pyridoxal phosphate-dependent transferase [Neohortaea acidophila]KAF2478621.1 pyridoxal phosphate-dependent transferase [Neohortaea acidophila]
MTIKLDQTPHKVQANGHPESFIFHRSQRTKPANIISGSGIKFTLDNGRTIIDASAGPAVACLGHSEPRVAQAVMRQMESLSYAYSMGYTTDAAEDLAAHVLHNRPGGLGKAIFVNSGSEATDAALKLATQYWIEAGRPSKNQFIARKQSYHGNTLGALCVSGHESRREFYQPWMSKNVTFVDPCYAYRGQGSDETDAQYLQRLETELEETIVRIGSDNVAAFILETIPGTTLGCVPPVPGYLSAMRRICDKHGILLMLDEIMCGMGKTGKMHAWECEGDFRGPDIQTIGKALGGGFVPISGVLASQKIFDAIAQGSQTLAHGHTFQAHPNACAAALEVQKIIAERDLLGNVAARGEQLEREMKAELSSLPHVGNIRGRGLFWAIEFMKDPAARTPFARGSGYSDRVVEVAQGLGLNILGTLGHTGEYHVEHVIISPPYIISQEEVSEVVRLLRETIVAVDQEGKKW